MEPIKTILAVDGNSIINRAFYAIRSLSTRDGQPTNAIYGMINIILKQWEFLHPDAAVIAFDLKAPTFRHQMYADYKAGRRPTPPELLAQFAPGKECAEILGFHVLEKEGYEADDILGTVAKMAAEQGALCYILTGDRDALQLISPQTHVLLATNSDTIDMDEAAFSEKYGVLPSQFVDVKALMGDASDHIPGVPGIGEKTALRLIAEYGSLDHLYETLPHADHTPSLRKKLTEGKESAYLSQTLATICRDVPLDHSLEDWRSDGMDSSRALAFFTRMEFSALIKRFSPHSAAKTMPVSSSESGQISMEEALLPRQVTHPAPQKQADRTNAAALLAMSPDAPLAIFVHDENLMVYDGARLLCCPISKENRGQIETFLTRQSRLLCYDSKVLYQTLERFGIHFRSAYFDVMLAAYVLNAGEGSFDLERLALSYLRELYDEEKDPCAPLIWRLYEVLNQELEKSEQASVFYDMEMPLSTVLCDMEREGFQLDCDGLSAYGKQLELLTRDLEEKIYAYVGHEFNIHSPKQLGVVLFEELALPAPKKTKTGYSTGADVLEKLQRFHPIISDILEYRQVTKLKSTYVDGLLKLVDDRGRVHTTFKQTGTVTGRLSSAEPNLQNIPIRTEMGRELRRFFVPKNDEYVFVDADYSQIELRLLAAISDDEAMKEAFCSGKDIHTSTASTVFGVDPEHVTLELRKRAKAINFGIVYGMGDFSLAEDLHIPRAKAKEYIESYLASYPRVDQYLKEIKKKARADGYVTTTFGRRRYIPELSSPNKMTQAFGERVAMNSPIQGTAADVIKIAMIAVVRRLKETGIDAKLVLQVHDELILEARRDVAAQAEQILRDEMEHAAAFSVPLRVEVSIGDDWYDAK